MGSLPPLALPFLAVLAVAFVGGVAAYVRDRRRFSGYRHLMREVLRLRKALKGEVFRDGADLVVNGTWRGSPTEIRVSHSENTPGIDIRMGAPAGFSLFVSPKNWRGAEGGTALRTQDEMFNVRAQVRSNHPTQASLFLSTKNVVSSLAKLYRSQAFMHITTGVIELSDLEPPTLQTMSGVETQLDAMSALCNQLKQMPGSDQVKIERLKREPQYLFKTVMFAGIAAATVALLITAFAVDEEPLAPHRFVPDGVTVTDAALIGGVGEWRLVLSQNFDPEAVAWLRANGMQATGRVPADFSGQGSDLGVAYVFGASDGRRRVVILSRGKNVYDSVYPSVGIAARVKRGLVPGIKWQGDAPENPDGDGLLILRTPNDPASGLIIFTKGDRIVSAAPKDYRNIRLE